MNQFLYNCSVFGRKVKSGYFFVIENVELFFREIFAILVDWKKKTKFFIKNPREILATKTMNKLVERTRELAFENANLAIFIAHVVGNAWVEIDGTRVYGYSRVLYIETPVGQISFPVYFEFWNQLESFPTFDTRDVLPAGEERVYEHRASKWDTHSAQDSLHRLAMLYDLVDSGKLLEVLIDEKPILASKNPKKNPNARRKNR